jgi:hypothetical protein
VRNESLGFATLLFAMHLGACLMGADAIPAGDQAAEYFDLTYITGAK